MRAKAAKALRKATYNLGGNKPFGYEVVPHTVRQKEFRHPGQLKDGPPAMKYTTATLRLVPDCARARYQRAKLNEVTR